MMDVNFTDLNGITRLMIAIEKEDEKFFDFLVKRADIGKASMKGDTALTLALQYDRQTMFQALIEEIKMRSLSLYRDFYGEEVVTDFDLFEAIVFKAAGPTEVNPEVLRRLKTDIIDPLKKSANNKNNEHEIKTKQEEKQQVSVSLLTAYTGRQTDDLFASSASNNSLLIPATDKTELADTSPKFT